MDNLHFHEYLIFLRTIKDSRMRTPDTHETPSFRPKCDLSGTWMYPVIKSMMATGSYLVLSDNRYGKVFLGLVVPPRTLASEIV